MNLQKALLTFALVSTLAGAAHAQSEAPAPGVVVQGSSDVQSGGLPAARVGDATTTPGGGVSEGSSDVFINGKPAARGSATARIAAGWSAARATCSSMASRWRGSGTIRPAADAGFGLVSRRVVQSAPAAFTTH